MKIRLWLFTRDHGDGSSGVYVFPTQEGGMTQFKLDDEGFGPYDTEIPVQIEWVEIETNDYEEVLKDV